ncbi:M48 family metallopeptidase [Streptacidiphilus monticola]|uniref:M48 family metallopeptidase n=1 Tax=Streptacidiphilus monticola TaxID=2161674 RepID=A0ABW1FVK4_9ACTN
MTTIPAASAALCDDCGEPLTADPRFVRWCPACGWNARPGGAPRSAGAETAVELRFLAAARTSARLRPQRDLAWLATVLVAGLVHLLTLGVTVGGVDLLVTGHLPAKAVGLVLLCVAFSLRPRLGSLRSFRRNQVTLDRDQAPAFYALLDEVADHLGARRVRTVALRPDYNAFHARLGLLQRPVLGLGLPLWETLDPRQRIALLAHEFGHGANGDARRSLWTGVAVRTLAVWSDLLTPAQMPVRNLVELIARWTVYPLMALLAHLVRRLAATVHRLTLRSGRQAEYLADAFSVRLAGTEATADLLAALTLGNSVAHVVRRRRNAQAGTPRRRGERAPRPEADTLWPELREYLASIPAEERERRLRVSELEGTAVDSGHPPTHLRLEFVRGLPPWPGELTPPDFADIDAELAAARREIARQLQ